MPIKAFELLYVPQSYHARGADPFAVSMTALMRTVNLRMYSSRLNSEYSSLHRHILLSVTGLIEVYHGLLASGRAFTRLCQLSLRILADDCIFKFSQVLMFASPSGLQKTCYTVSCGGIAWL